jgi:hypothetical protein
MADDLTELTIEYRAVVDLHPHPNNPRVHSPEQLEQLFASVSRFGWTAPIIIDEDQTILAGHGRWQMCRANQIHHVPTITVTGLTAEEKRAYLIADNKLTENGQWDVPMLVSELDFLRTANFESDTLGFTDADLIGLSAQIDDADFPEDAGTHAPGGRPGRSIESETEPTCLQGEGNPNARYDEDALTPGGPSADVAATLVPFSVMLPADDRETLFEVLNFIKGDDATITTAMAVMALIDSFNERRAEEEQDDVDG